MREPELKPGHNFKGIIYLLVIIITLGLIVMYSASLTPVVRSSNLDFSDYLGKQLFNIAVGLIAMFVIALVPFHKHLQWAPFYLIAEIFLLLAVFLFPSTGGAFRWIPLGFFNLQPSELAKIVLILFLPSFFRKHSFSDRKTGFFDAFLIPFGWICLLGVLIALEPDLSTSVIVFLLGFLIMFVAGLRKFYLFLVVGLVVVAVVLAFQLEILRPYQLDRVRSFFSLFSSGEAQGQIQVSMDAIASGGLMGEGLALGEVKYSLPVKFTDFIFAIFGEELGFIGMAFLLILYYLFGRNLIHAALVGIESPEGKLVLIGYAFLVLLQVVINVGVVLGILPPTGITLPFVSYGGSSMIAFLSGFGLVLSVLHHRETT
ncbi:MAG TPA: FtsW/RodA/SpoVE family cell cycle protein [Thermotogota bacterium]|nr:FtsW/RodA/SpoVE family cell cycle protein [Thermotogota bacterium]